MYAFKASDGSLEWAFETNGDVFATPAVDGGVVYFGAWDSCFYAVDASTGVEVGGGARAAAWRGALRLGGIAQGSQ